MQTETQVRKQILLRRRSPNYWRVTIDHPPLNIFGPDTIPQLDEVITAIETDEAVKVVVFDSAVEGFFLTHYDFVAPVENTTRLPPGPTGLQPLPDMLVRLSRAPVVSIASIRGRATGVGSELALACDMRFASREKAILSHFEVGAGVVPGGGPMARLPRLMGRGRALEVLLGADDIPGDLAERYGYVIARSRMLTLMRLSSLSQPASHRSTNGRSARPNASPTWPVCRLTSKSRRSGMCVLPRSCGRPHKNGSRS
jgi:enoyl-CoA hydratase/carnithine racemase